MDRRNKMIDNSKMVFECLRCGRKMIGDINTNVKYCPRCNSTDTETLLVIVDNLVIKK